MIRVLVGLFAFIFLILLISTGASVRPTADDFLFMITAKEHSWWFDIQFHYEFWNTRYCSVAIQHLLQKAAQGWPGIIPVYLVGSIFFLMMGIYRVVGQLKRFFNYSTGNRFVLSVLLTGGIILGSISIPETWFWTTGSTTYVLSFASLIWGFSLLFSTNKISVWIAPIFFFYIGGSLGPLALVTILVLVLLLLLKKWRVIPSLVLLSFAFILLYFAPGNRNRELFFENHGVLNAILYNFKFVGIVLLKKLPLSALISLPLAWTFSSLVSISERFFATKRMLLITAGVGVLIYGYCLPITYKTNDIPAPRASLFISVLIFLYTIYLLNWIHYKAKIDRHPSGFMGSAASVFLIVFLGYQTLTKTGDFAAEYDHRMELLELRKNEPRITIHALPESGWVYHQEISGSPNHHSQLFLRKYLEIPEQTELIVIPLKPNQKHVKVL